MSPRTAPRSAAGRGKRPRDARAVAVAEVALVDGAPGIVVAPRGRLEVVLQTQVTGRRITEIRVVADPRLLERLEITLLPLA